MKKKTNINEKLFLKKLKAIKKLDNWTKEKHQKKDDLLSYIDSHNHISFLTNYYNNSFDFTQKSWEFKKYKVHSNKRGHLKVYRGLRIILLNVGKFNMFKLKIIALPYKDNE